MPNPNPVKLKWFDRAMVQFVQQVVSAVHEIFREDYDTPLTLCVGEMR